MTEAPVEVRKAAPLPASLAILEPWNLWRGEFDRVFERMFAGGIPPLRRLLINKLDPPLSDHERFIYDIAMRSLTYPVEAPLS